MKELLAAPDASASAAAEQDPQIRDAFKSSGRTGLMPFALNPVENSPTLKKTVKDIQYSNFPDIPDYLKLDNGPFDFAKKKVLENDIIEVFAITFPSPVKTEHVVNNTVHGELYLPKGKSAKVPGIIVLHILEGKFQLARIMSCYLASRGMAALFIKMPYYGERRPRGKGVRMVSEDIDSTVSNIKQAVLDVRRAAAVLSAQDEVEKEKIGIAGISLGGIVAAFASGVEPRIKRSVFILAGGDIANVLRQKYAGRPQAKTVDFENLEEKTRPIDPITYAGNIRAENVLMINAADDEIVPKTATEQLAGAIGHPEVKWFQAGHLTMVMYIFQILDLTCGHFENWE